MTTNKLAYVAYHIEPTTNLPNKNRVFVTCSHWNMQPYLADSIIANNSNDAVRIIWQNIQIHRPKIQDVLIFVHGTIDDGHADLIHIYDFFDAPQIVDIADISIMYYFQHLYELFPSTRENIQDMIDYWLRDGYTTLLTKT